MATTLLERPSESVSTVLLDLATLPGILVAWGYALGAAKADRPEVMARLFQTPLHDSSRSKPTKAALRLNIEAWSSSAASLRKSFEGMERHYLPACDVLQPMFAEWLADGFELAWGWTELLLGVEFLTDRWDKDSLKSAVETAGGSSYVPMGRIAYSSTRGRVCWSGSDQRRLNPNWRRLGSRLATRTISRSLTNGWKATPPKMPGDVVVRGSGLTPGSGTPPSDTWPAARG
ncbi:hypothetical protein D3C72_829360 [compost metagenome]